VRGVARRGGRGTGGSQTGHRALAHQSTFELIRTHQARFNNGIEKMDNHVGGVEAAQVAVSRRQQLGSQQTSLEAYSAHPAQPVGSLVTGQQNERAFAVCEVESPFQGGEILQQLSAHTVDCPVPIRCEVIAACA
jgi:hypothetical protein